MTSSASPALPRLADFRRLVIKVGSSLLVDAAGVRRSWLDSLAADIAALQARGAEVMVVSSGSIALGRRILAMPPGMLKLEDSQAAAAVGQIALARTWAEALGALASTRARAKRRASSPGGGAAGRREGVRGGAGGMAQA